jgi:lysophospholipase L1-like esterase
MPGPAVVNYPNVIPPIYRNTAPDAFTRANTSTGGAGTNTGAGNGWVDIQGGVAQIASNQLKLTSDSAGSGTDQYLRDYTVRPTTENSLDHSIEFDIPAQVWNSAASFGPAVRFQSATKNAYIVRCHGDGTNFQMYKIVGGAVTGIVGPTTLGSFSQGTNYHVRMSAEGSCISFELTNKDTGAVVLNLQATDTTINTAGTQGFCGPWDVAATSILLDNAQYSSSTTIKLGGIGDSIMINVPPSGLKAPGASLARALATRTRREYTMSNQAISGKTSADWSGDVGGILTTAKAAFATAGVTDVHIMLGTNDSKTAVATTKAGYKSNMSTLANNLVAAGYRVFLHAPPYLTPGAFAQFDVASIGLLIQYRDALVELSNGGTIIIGDLQSFSYFKRFQNQLTDLLHPTVDGGEAIADLWAEAIWKNFL